MVDHQTGWEAGWGGEVGTATASSRIAPGEANEIALKLPPFYKDTFDIPNPGKGFSEMTTSGIQQMKPPPHTLFSPAYKKIPRVSVK